MLSYVPNTRICHKHNLLSAAIWVYACMIINANHSYLVHISTVVPHNHKLNMFIAICLHNMYALQ